MYIIKAQSSLVFYSNACFWLVSDILVSAKLQSIPQVFLTTPFLFIKSSPCDVMIITKLRSTNKTPSRTLHAHTKYEGD